MDDNVDKIGISVVIPFYNVADYILGTLESVVNQNFKNYELILINDGSTDDSLSIVNEFLKYTDIPYRIYSQGNKGVSAARNEGIKKSRGEYILFLDADDQIRHDCLLLLYTKARELDLDLVFGGFDYVTPDGKVIRRYEDEFHYIEKVLNGKKVLMLYLTSYVMIWTGSALYKKRVLLKNNIFFNPNISYGEDQEFIAKALFHSSRVFCVHEAISYYALRPNSLTALPTLKQFQVIDMFSSLVEYFKAHNADERIIEIIQDYKIPFYLVDLISTFVHHESLKYKMLNMLRNKDIKKILKRPKFSKLVKNKLFLKKFFKTKLLLYFPNIFLNSYLYYTRYKQGGQIWD